MASRLVHTVVAKLPPPLRRLIRRARIKRMLATFHERTFTGTYGHGVELTLSFQDPLAESWYGSLERHNYPDITAARGYGLREGAIVFDIGAHQAIVALVLADVVGQEGRVVAVEADRHNARVARRNVDLNHALNVTVVESACADQPGIVSFHEGLNGAISRSRVGAHRVRAVTVDELSRRYGRPDLVYLDIEGHEQRALSGALETLAAGSTFVIEVHCGGKLEAAGGSVSELAAILIEHSYQLRYMTDEGWWANEEFQPASPRELPNLQRFFLLAHR